MIPAADLPECPQCGFAIRQAERVGVSAHVQPCGHFIPADFFEPTHVETSVGRELVADGGVVREDLSTFGGGVDHGPHVSLMDCAAAVRAAGIDEPPLADPIRSWRGFKVECDERVFRTTLYAVRRACPDAPAVPPTEPPETDYAFEVVGDNEPEQATLVDLVGGDER